MAQEVAKAIENEGGRAIAILADAGDAATVRAAVARTVEIYGGIDMLVNNAGLSLGGPIEAISFEDYQRLIAVSVTGVFVVTQEAVRNMKERGRIIHIGSSMTRYTGCRRAIDQISTQIDEEVQRCAPSRSWQLWRSLG